MISLKEHLLTEAKRFVIIVVNSMSLLFLAATIALAIIQARQIETGQTDISVLMTFTSLASLSSGILGGIWAKKWEDLTEERVIVARGEMAIRRLIVLSNDITTLKRRTVEYLGRLINEEYEGDITPEVIKTYVEEVIIKCRTLETAVLSSINDWNDVIPTADIQKQAGIALESLLERTRLLDEAQSLREQLEESRTQTERSEEEKVRLRAQLRETQTELADARQKQWTKDPLGVGAVALTTGSSVDAPGVFYSSSLIGHDLTIEGKIQQFLKCANCGRPWTTFEHPAAPMPLLCPECQAKGRKTD